MAHFEKYFNLPIFESVKSTYAVRYQNEFEKSLLERMEAAPQIKSFFQPLTSVAVKIDSHKYSIDIDFYVEYTSGNIELVHIAAENKLPPELRLQIFTLAKSQLQIDNFRFVVVEANKSRKLLDTNAKREHFSFANKFCFANFGWIN